MRVLITGATGLIGQQIVKSCHEQGILVNYLTTNKSKIKTDGNYQGFYWNLESQEIDKACFRNVDAIIHLAGATVSKKWTPQYKKEIISSRVEGIRLLVNALKGESHNIKQVVSASGISMYPSSLTNYYEENFKGFDTSFLGEVVKQWEAAVELFTDVNISTSKVRIGLVMSNKGGALPQMVKPIKFGVGAAFGSGKQWQSWIHIEDLANMFLFILKNGLMGSYNGVAPNPVTNKELTRTIAKVLGKPLILPNIPKFVMKLILGEMHTVLFDSQRVSSKKIESKGFHFVYHHLEPALQNLI
ncbi:TIGR01777 family protein [Seonamhaeicola sediminis]|uniref:TIGR01777 family protein n=1 Tax=Seonamhaeicola sediminis TaxID=2528206 RepID=A0A562YDI6_9FLAO|nr:TIGR01777 family oxidoreductase [Seonamhaeicola sediminis]TWO32650.1 TIGR01777 family protein [Seonamhaeicola sediminis]